MKTGLNQSTQLRQELKINPRLYQAMDLLYMPLLDLQQHLKQELLNNPFLELVEPEEDEEEETAEAETPTEQAAEEQKADEIDWEEILLEGFDAGGRREESYTRLGCCAMASSSRVKSLCRFGAPRRSPKRFSGSNLPFDWSSLILFEASASCTSR